MCVSPIMVMVDKIIDGKECRVPVTVGCGKCIECLNAYSEEWATRIVDEASLYPLNCFVTLTYDNEHCPLELVKSDLQVFIRELRRNLSPHKIRYFACGEYGEKGGRPHYHLIIFNFMPNDLELYRRGPEPLFKSAFLSDIWQKGFVSVGAVSRKSAKYCAKYMQKALHIPKTIEQPFTLCSTRPGIGYGAIRYDNFENDKIYHDGKIKRLPRYYLKVLERDGFDLSALKNVRMVKADITLNEASIEVRKKKSVEFFRGY